MFKSKRLFLNSALFICLCASVHLANAHVIEISTKGSFLETFNFTSDHSVTAECRALPDMNLTLVRNKPRPSEHILSKNSPYRNLSVSSHSPFPSVNNQSRPYSLTVSLGSDVLKLVGEINYNQGTNGGTWKNTNNGCHGEFSVFRTTK